MTSAFGVVLVILGYYLEVNFPSISFWIFIIFVIEITEVFVTKISENFRQRNNHNFPNPGSDGAHGGRLLANGLGARQRCPCHALKVLIMIMVVILMIILMMMMVMIFMTTMIASYERTASGWLCICQTVFVCICQ